MGFLTVLGFSQHIFELDGLTTYRVAVGLVLLFVFLHSSVVAYASWKRLKTDRTRVIGTGETIKISGAGSIGIDVCELAKSPEFKRQMAALSQMRSNR